MTSPKPPLKPGDRVAVYGTNVLKTAPHERKTGTVIGGGKSGNSEHFVNVDLDGGEKHCTFHAQQCRRLKAKPRPQQEGKERLQYWVLDTGKTVNFSREPVPKFNHVQEVREGERVVSREDLARAWNENKGCFGVNDCGDTVGREHFNAFCKALGLESRTA